MAMEFAAQRLGIGEVRVYVSATAGSDAKGPLRYAPVVRQ